MNREEIKVAIERARATETIDRYMEELRKLLMLHNQQVGFTMNTLQEEIYLLTDALFRWDDADKRMQCSVPVWQELEEVIHNCEYKIHRILDKYEE